MSTNETAAQRRLDALRAEAAALDVAETASAAEPGPRRVARVGDVIHGLSEAGVTILRSVSMFGAASVTLYRGDELVIDAAMLEADLNRHGQPAGWSALIHDEDEQLVRWGEVRIRAGRAPHGMQPWTHGSALWSELRETARRAAWAEPNPGRRAAALKAVTEVYGPGPTTSQTLNSAPDPSVAAAKAQQAAIDAGGVRQASHYAPRERGGHDEDRG